MQEPFLINPFKKGSKAAKLKMAKVRAARGRKNLKGGLTVAERKNNDRLKKLFGGKKVASKKSTKRSKKRATASLVTKLAGKRYGYGMKRHRPVVYETGNHKMFTSDHAKIVKKHIRVNPFGEELMMIGANPRRKRATMASRKFRKNPIVSMGLLKLVIAGGVGALAAKIVPGMLGLTGWKAYAAQAGILIGGSYGAAKFMSNEVGTAVAVGAGAILVTEATAGMLSPAVATPAAVAGYVDVAGIEDRSVMASGPYQNTIAMG